jgi:hypothetical protein
MKKTLSTYSRMFLVTPTVYEKLLNCIDEKDKKVTQDLNISKEKAQRPSDDYIQELNIESFNEPREVDPEYETESGVGDITETEPESDVIYRDDPNVIESESAEPLPQSTGQLDAPCVRSEQGEVIPQGGLIYRPNQKANFKAVKEPFVSVPRLSQQEIDQYTKPNIEHRPVILKKPLLSVPKLDPMLVDAYTNKPNVSIPKLVPPQISLQRIQHKPFVFKKPVLSIPKLDPMVVDAYTNKPSVAIPRLNPPQITLQNIPKLQQDQIDAFSKSASSKQKTIIPSIKKKKDTVKTKNYQCPVCMKFWRSKWDLKRHTSTVHANVGNVQPLPDTDDIMLEQQQQQQQEDFPAWKRTKPQKRSSSQAKLPTLKPKFRPPGGDDEGEYESWNK